MTDAAPGRPSSSGVLKPGPFRLSVRQAACVVFYLTLCVTPFSFGEQMIHSFGRWAWFPVLPGFALGSLTLAAVAVLRDRLPAASVLDYAPALLGRFPGWLYLALLFLTFAAGAGINLSVFVDMLHTTLTPGLSGWAPALVMAALAAYVAFFGPEVIARAATALLFGVVPGLVLVFTLPWLNAVPGRLWPFWTIPWDEVARHPDTATILGACRGFLPLFVLAPMVEGRGFLPRTFAVQTLASVLIMLSFAIPVAVLGPALAQQLRFPLLDTVGTVTWLWLPVQRLGHLAALVWEIITFVVAATYIWVGAVLAGWLFLRGSWRPFIPVLGVATLVLAGPLLGSQVEEMLLTVWEWGVIGLGILVPIGLAAAVWRRRPA